MYRQPAWERSKPFTSWLRGLVLHHYGVIGRAGRWARASRYRFVVFISTTIKTNLCVDGIITYLLTKALPWKYWSLVTRSQVIEKVNVTRCCQAWYLANLLKIKNFGERKTLLRDGNSITFFTATRTKSMLPRTVVKVIQYSNVSTTRPGTKIFTLSEIREPSPARLYLQPQAG